MFEPSSKKTLIAVLVVCYAIQSGLVYSDEKNVPLSQSALQGREIFHENACQVCHQLYGQGGFLGPDLTNAGSRVDEARLASLLTVGSGQMPAFRMDAEQIAHVAAFLAEIDRPDLGLGQLRLGEAGDGMDLQAAFSSAMRGAGAPPEVAAGFEVFSGGICSTCHLPFRTSVVNAPDLSTAVERWDDDALHQVLTTGRPERGMPPPMPAFTDAQRESVITYLRWLNENRDDLMAGTQRLTSARSVDWSGLSWWEYR